MAYVTVTKDKYGRDEAMFDRLRFVEDLAKAMGATVRRIGEEYDNRATVVLPDWLEISVYWQGYGAAAKSGKVELSLGLAGIPNDLYPGYGHQYKLPSISVNTNRPISSIVADINRRLLPAAAEPIAAIRKYAEERQGYRSRLAEMVQLMRAEFPELKITASEESASFVQTRMNPYMSGIINADRTVSINNISSLPFEAFCEIVEVLYRTHCLRRSGSWIHDRSVQTGSATELLRGGGGGLDVDRRI
jgi:hypothetical protein